MMLYHTPDRIARLFPQAIFHMPREEKKLYLSFDDGPHPEITPWVMEQLKIYEAQATFFCVGENFRKHPELTSSYREAGHVVGNHTYNHLNGWMTSASDYLANIEACEEMYPTHIFRPPYGKIGSAQLRSINKTHKVYLWDVLTGDFNRKLDANQCMEHVLKYTQAGSILVLHDSEKAWPRLKELLPRILEHYSNLGFIFEGLPEN